MGGETQWDIIARRPPDSCKENQMQNPQFEGDEIMGNNNEEKRYKRSFSPPREQDLEVGGDGRSQKDHLRIEHKQETPIFLIKPRENLAKKWIERIVKCLKK